MAGQKLARFCCETDNHMEKSIASGTQMTEMSANEKLINLLGHLLRAPARLAHSCGRSRIV